MISGMRSATAVLAFAAVLGSPALAENETADTVMATVNGVEITLGQMIAVREGLPQQYLALPDDALFTGILDQLVQQEVLAQSVTEQTARDKANVTNNLRGYLSGVVIAAAAEGVVTDEALQKAYDEKYAKAEAAKEFSASHILLPTRELAVSVKEQLDGGADFAEIAKAQSMDTGSGAQGGALGWFGAGMMVKPFEDAVLAAEIGKVTDPVETQFGWHLILLQEVRDAAKPTIDDVRDELAFEIEDTAVRAKLDALTAAAKVEKPGAELDPALLKNSALID